MGAKVPFLLRVCGLALVFAKVGTVWYVCSRGLAQ